MALAASLWITGNFRRLSFAGALIPEDLETFDVYKRELNKPAITRVKHLSDDIVMPMPDCNRKLLFYGCSEETPGKCNGLGDRQRGIVSAFLLAILSNRTFGITSTRPCQLSNYLVPNEYNWSKCLHMVKSAKDKHVVDYMDNIGNLPDLETLTRGYIWKENIVIVKTNVFLHERIKQHPNAAERIPWIFRRSLKNVVKKIYHILFKLEASVRHNLKQYVKNITAQGSRLLVGVHIRTKFIAVADIEFILKFLDRFSNKSTYAVYIATDDNHLRKQAASMFENAFTLDVKCVTLHVNAPTATCTSLFYAVLEQEILAMSDILIKTRSSYSFFASMIKESPGNVYHFKGTADSVTPHFVHTF